MGRLPSTIAALCGIIGSATGALAAPPGHTGTTTPRLLSLAQVSTPVVGGCSGGADTPQESVDPTNPAHRVITYLTGNGVASVAAATTDNGRHWRRSLLSGLTTCSQGPDGSLNDPYLALVGDRSVVTNSWVTNSGNTAVDHDAIRDFVSTSSDGAQTFGSGSDLEPTQPDQRAPVLIDADTPDHVFVEVERAHWLGPVGYDYLPDQAVVLRSTDGGATFGAPVALGSALPPSAALSGGIVKSGATIIAMYEVVNYDEFGTVVTGGTLDETVEVVRSTDDGRTFGMPVALGSLGFPLSPLGSKPPLNPAGCCIPSLSSAADGSLAATWTDASGDVALARSTDAGAHWRLTRLTASHGAMEPSVSALPDGGAAVFYFDRWPDAAGTALAQPTVAVVSGSDHMSRLTIAAPFDIVALTDGTQDAGPIGPYQGIAYEAGRHILDVALALPATVSDVQVFEARIAV